MVAICGIGLLLLAFGVRRGQRHAWMLANALLLVAVVGNVTKGLDIEEAIVALARRRCSCSSHRDDFAAPANPSSWRRAHRRRARRRSRSRSSAGRSASRCGIPNLSLGEDRRGGRANGSSACETIALPNSIDRLVSPALLAVGVVHRAVVVLAAVPARGRRRGLSSYRPLSRERARFIVERYGTDSLSYFALRDDKEWFGFRDTLVAYRVHNGIALVSPDPIGPVGQRAEAWGAFREFADEHGWPVAVMGACGRLAARVRRERDARPLHRRRSGRRRAAVQPRRQAEQEPAPVGRAGSRRRATASSSSIPSQLDAELRGEAARR